MIQGFTLHDKIITELQGYRCPFRLQIAYIVYVLSMQLGNIKMTVGLQKATGDKVQYCITSI